VPLIISAPGMAGNGRASDAIVESLDIYPTLCATAGVPPPATLEGQSLMKILQSPQARGKNFAYSEFPAPALREWAARPLSPAMRQTFFGPLIESVETQLKKQHGSRYNRQVFEDHVKGYSVRTPDFRYTRWIDRRDPGAEPLAEELYDHRSDPHETINVSKDPRHAKTMNDLASLVQRIVPNSVKK
jgi:iduronate 2-sulfatase